MNATKTYSISRKTTVFCLSFDSKCCSLGNVYCSSGIKQEQSRSRNKNRCIVCFNISCASLVQIAFGIGFVFALEKLAINLCASSEGSTENSFLFAISTLTIFFFWKKKHVHVEMLLKVLIDLPLMSF